MKRYIRATEEKHSDAEKYFDSLIDSARHAGYKMQVSDNLKVMLTPEQDIDTMPTITVDTVKIEDEKYKLEAKVEFPTLEYDDGDYADHIEYIIKRWQKVGTFITELQEEVIDFGVSYADDEEE